MPKWHTKSTTVTIWCVPTGRTQYRFSKFNHAGCSSLSIFFFFNYLWRKQWKAAVASREERREKKRVVSIPTPYSTQAFRTLAFLSPPQNQRIPAEKSEKDETIFFPKDTQSSQNSFHEDQSTFILHHANTIMFLFTCAHGHISCQTTYQSRPSKVHKQNKKQFDFRNFHIHIECDCYDLALQSSTL